MPEHKVLTDEISDYLNDLRDSGQINMMFAQPYIERRFNLMPDDASTAMSEWMGSFK